MQLQCNCNGQLAWLPTPMRCRRIVDQIKAVLINAAFELLSAISMHICEAAFHRSCSICFHIFYWLGLDKLWVLGQHCWAKWKLKELPLPLMGDHCIKSFKMLELSICWWFEKSSPKVAWDRWQQGVESTLLTWSKLTRCWQQGLTPS